MAHAPIPTQMPTPVDKPLASENLVFLANVVKNLRLARSWV